VIRTGGNRFSDSTLYYINLIAGNYRSAALQSAQ